MLWKNKILSAPDAIAATLNFREVDELDLDWPSAPRHSAQPSGGGCLVTILETSACYISPSVTVWHLDPKRLCKADSTWARNSAKSWPYGEPSSGYVTTGKYGLSGIPTIYCTSFNGALLQKALRGDSLKSFANELMLSKMVSSCLLLPSLDMPRPALIRPSPTSY